MHNANSNIFGEKASSTVPTTPVNTTQHGTIKMSENFMSLTVTSCLNNDKATNKLIDILRGCVNYPHIQVLTSRYLLSMYK